MLSFFCWRLFYAGCRTVFNAPWFWKYFLNARNFQNSPVSFTCDCSFEISNWHVNLAKNYSKLPRFDKTSSVDNHIWTVLTEKEPGKVKPPLEAPKKSRDFGKFLGFLKPNRVELITREYLNYSNITWKCSLILKIPCVLKIFSRARALKKVLRPALRG